MYELYYRLDTDPFRLSADLRFVFHHKAYRKAIASMRCTLRQMDGIPVITGPPGTGKTLLIQSFCAELHSDNIAFATLASSHLTADDVLTMVAYEFGLTPGQNTRPMLLHLLQKTLSRKTCAVLVIDEAQNLSAAALDELCMLSNLQHGSRPLLQIFLVGQEALHTQLHAPGMEHLHQRLSTTIRLQHLGLQETCELVTHRLASAGWRGSPAFDAEIFPISHRFSQGIARYICKFFSRLFLYGATNERRQLSVDDALVVIAALEQEMLLPMYSEQGGGTAEPLPPLADLMQSPGCPLGQRLSLSAEETAFLTSTPGVLQAPPNQAMSHTAARSPAGRGPTPDWLDRRPWPVRIIDNTVREQGRLALRFGTLLAVLIFGSYKFGVTAGRNTPTLALAVPIPAAESTTQKIAAAPASLAEPGQTPTPAAIVPEPDAPPARTYAAYQSIPAPSLKPTLAQAQPHPPLRSITAAPDTGESNALLSAEKLQPVTVTAAALTGRQKLVTELLQLAELAFASDHLKVPKSANAWSYYRQVLALDPANAAADKGLQQIASRYAELAQWKISEQDYDQADIYLNRGLTVSAEHAQLLALGREIVSLRAAEAQAAAEAEATVAAAQLIAEPEATPEPEREGFFTALKRIFGGEKESGQ